MVGSTGFPCQDWCWKLLWKSPVNPLAGIIDTRLHVFSTLPQSALWWSSMNWVRMPSAKPCCPMCDLSKFQNEKNVNIFCSTYHDGIWGFTERTCAWLAAIRLLGTRTLGDCRKLQVKDSHSPRYLERFQKLDLTTFGTYALRSWNFNGRWLWNRLGHCKTFGWGLEQAQFQKIYFACAFCGFVAT